MRSPRLAAAALAAILSGCSGPVLPLLPTSEPHAVAEIPVDQAAARALVTAYRASHGLSAVAIDPDLERVAQAQADAMASADHLSHTVAGSLPERLASYHADKRASIENVSAGYADLPAALGGWRRSPAHNANLLFGPMRRLGIAEASAPDTHYKTFWALVMTN